MNSTTQQANRNQENNMATCPHCGNSNPDLLQDNGCSPTDPDLTLLCVKPCTPEESSLDDFDRADPTDREKCYMQWEPNSDLI